MIHFLFFLAGIILLGLYLWLEKYSIKGTFYSAGTLIRLIVLLAAIRLIAV